MTDLSMREAYGQTLLELGEKNSQIISVDADVATSTRSIYFAERFPERSFNVGIAELHMCAMAAGLAASGKMVFVNAFAVFLSLRAADAIHNLIAQDNLNVKLMAAYSGYSGGLEGASHHSINDIAHLRSMPNMTVIVAADNHQARQAVFAAAEHNGPVYLRLLRTTVPDVYTSNNCPFEIGKANQLLEGEDVAIIATGSMVAKAIEAGRQLTVEGISARVIDMHTIKPIDTEAVLKAAKATGCIVTAEEHSTIGGLGSAVGEVLLANSPVPLESVGVEDFFSESGEYEDLLAKAGLTVENIIAKAKKVIKRKENAASTQNIVVKM